MFHVKRPRASIVRREIQIVDRVKNPPLIWSNITDLRTQGELTTTPPSEHEVQSDSHHAMSDLAVARLVLQASDGVIASLPYCRAVHCQGLVACYLLPATQ